MWFLCLTPCLTLAACCCCDRRGAEPLLAGLPQSVRFTLLTGYYDVKKGDALQLSNSDAMPLLPCATCMASILSPTAGEGKHTTHTLGAEIIYFKKGLLN